MTRLIAVLLLLPLMALPATAATFEYDIEITSITGEGEASGIGFFSTGSVGDAGTGMAIVDESFPGDYPMTLEATQFFAQFPGVASAVTFFQKTVIHDTVAGTVSVSGQLGGLTGVYPGFFISPSAYEFVYTGMTGGPLIASEPALSAFLETATMSGFVTAFFVDGQGMGYEQTITFSADISDIPLPAGSLLLLTALGMAVVTRRG